MGFLLYNEVMKVNDMVFVYRLSGGDRLSWHGRYHAHDSSEYELHFFIEGTGSFQTNHTRYPISGGRIFLTGPREFHSIFPEETYSPLSWYAVLFSFPNENSIRKMTAEDSSLKQHLDSSLASRSTVLSIDLNFRFQFEDLLQLSRSPDESLRASAKYLLSSFLLRWFGRNSRPEDVSLDQKKQLHIEKALAYMEKEVRKKLTVEDIAWKLDLSAEHFIRIFKEEVRMTPYQYFTRLKVEGASGLLISTNQTVGEISLWFGFENQFHFSRVFKKCTGMSPLEYRKTYLQVVDFS